VDRKDLHREIKLIVENDKYSAFSRDKKGQSSSFNHRTNKYFDHGRDRDPTRKAPRIHPILAPNVLPIVETVGKLTRQPIVHPPNATTRVAAKFSTLLRSGSPISSRPSHGYRSRRGGARGGSGRGGGCGGGRGGGRGGREDTNKGRNVSFEHTPSAPPAKEGEIIKEEIPSKSIAKRPLCNTTREATGLIQPKSTLS
jgi:hypothetical protein